MVYVPRKDIRGKNPTGRESRVEYWKSKCIEELLRTTKKVQKSPAADHRQVTTEGLE